MTKKTNAFGALFLVLLLSGGLATSTTSSTSDDSSSDSSGGDPPTPQCEDGVDNDGDGFTDSEDPDCDINSPMYNGNES